MMWRDRRLKAPFGKPSDCVDRNFAANSPPFFYLIGYDNTTMWNKPQQIFPRRVAHVAPEVKFLRNSEAEDLCHD